MDGPVSVPDPSARPAPWGAAPGQGAAQSVPSVPPGYDPTAFPAPGSAWAPAPRPRRRTGLVWTVVVATVLTGGLAAGSVGALMDVWATSAAESPYADLVLTSGDLPEPASMSGKYPTPGFEEHAEPLGEPPAVDRPSKAYAFQFAQDAEGIPPDEAAPPGAEPVAWSPCRPIHVVVNTDGAPDGFLDEVRIAFGKVSAASGLVFTLDGRTSEPPDTGRASFLPHIYGDRWAPVLVAFGDRRSVPDLSGATLGITTIHTGTDSKDGTRYLVSANVYLDTQLLQMQPIGGDPAYVSVLLHELGHVAGLDHVDDPSQLMHPTVEGVVAFGDGDLSGLAELGQGSCAPGV